MKGMKTIMQKYEIIHLKVEGWSNSKIQRMYHVSRDTIRKYWTEYQHNLEQLQSNDPNVDNHSVIESIISTPHYDTSKRVCRKYNSEIDELLDKILFDEEKKTELLGKNHKQALSQVQIHSLITAQGYDIGLTTIQTKIKEKLNKHKEVFIQQNYPYGQRFEYDFGEVKLIIKGCETKAYLAVLTSPGSNFRWAYLYQNTQMDVFLDSQVKFFEMVGGCYEEGVYDNMRNVVTKFIGRNEKELNHQLIKLAIYYGFKINVTNCFSGNEKGTVESAVRWIRNKVYATKYQFSSFEEASDYLQKKLIEINKDSTIEEEKKFLTPYRPKYEVAHITINNVNKYSFIQIDTNFYSVPEQLVGKNVMVKKYPNDINVYYKNNLVTTHKRIKEKKKTCLNINHYLDTFLKKPGALRNSAALKSVPELKDIFDTYYKDKPKTFIELLRENKDLNLNDLLIKLNPTKTTIEETNWVETEVKKQLSTIANLFIGGTVSVN